MQVFQELFASIAHIARGVRAAALFQRISCISRTVYFARAIFYALRTRHSAHAAFCARGILRTRYSVQAVFCVRGMLYGGHTGIPAAQAELILPVAPRDSRIYGLIFGQHIHRVDPVIPEEFDGFAADSLAGHRDRNRGRTADHRRAADASERFACGDCFVRVKERLAD